MSDPRMHRRWESSSTLPRVLLECPPEMCPEIIGDSIERAGYQIATCTGPDRHHACELLVDGACSLVDDADVVVNVLGRRDGAPIANAIAGLRRPPGLVREVAVVPDGEVAPDGAQVLHSPATRQRLLDAIERALADSSPAGPPWGLGV